MVQRLKKYQFLFEELVKRDFKKKYKGTMLGMAWSLLSPLLTLLVMRIVFTQFFGAMMEHYTTYLFCGNLIFACFSEATGLGMTSLLENADIFSKINVPKYLFLFSKNIQSLINLGLTLIIFFLFCILDGITFTWKFILLLYPVVCLILFNIGVGLILSALFVFFRDVQYLWNVFTQLFLGICVILLLTGLTVVILVIERHRDTLKKMAITDPLTGLLNRKGFDEQLKKVMQGDLHIHCVGIQMDIDDFKFINDMYGHVVGDAALKSLAQDMQSYFNDNSIICRNGGDEFSAILVDTTEEEARKKIEQFTLQSRHITYNGGEHPFYISLGYAEYPKDCEDVSELIRCADMALYAVKLHGKNNCSPYRGAYKMQHRSQLGFALQDVSKNLPGAFLIYIADPENDNILFANRELIEFAGCRDFDDFLDYTDHRFRNLIHPDERDSVETSIWKQIYAKTSGNNDYVRFHFAKKRWNISSCS